MSEHYTHSKQIKDEKAYWQDKSSELEARITILSVELETVQQQSKEMRLEKGSYQKRESLILEYESRL